MTAQQREIIYIDDKEEQMAAEPIGTFPYRQFSNSV